MSSVAKLGPAPTLISRKEVSALYVVLEAVRDALVSLEVDFIVTGGSLLGAVRQQSILFCDDDIDIAIIDHRGDGAAHATVADRLSELLGPAFVYTVRPWEGGDRVRLKRMPSVFLDLFTLRPYANVKELRSAIGWKRNGHRQREEYVESLVGAMMEAAFAQGETAPLFPCFHFAERKAVELWTKEVYRHSELFPLSAGLTMGPVTGIRGPRSPVRLLKRAFGMDCFEVFFQGVSHNNSNQQQQQQQQQQQRGDEDEGEESEDVVSPLPPLLRGGGTWEGSEKQRLEEGHYVPMQPIERGQRLRLGGAVNSTPHGREQLFQYLAAQSLREEAWAREEEEENKESAENAWGQETALPPMPRQTPPTWFGAAVASATDNAATLPSTPFPPSLRAVLEPHLEKARVRRDEALAAVRNSTGAATYDKAMREFGVGGRGPGEEGGPGGLAEEGELVFDTALHPLRPAFLRSAGLAPDVDLSRLHEEEELEEGGEANTSRKDLLLRALTEGGGGGPGGFQGVFDEFVRTVCVPHLAKLFPALLLSSSCDDDDDDDNDRGNDDGDDDDDGDPINRERGGGATRGAGQGQTLAVASSPCVYYQSFPCVRVVQPDEFSIGPHCDAAYGHHPCSVNFYIPLTPIGGTSALYLESVPGEEDWHPIACLGEYGAEGNSSSSSSSSNSSGGDGKGGGGGSMPRRKEGTTTGENKQPARGNHHGGGGQRDGGEEAGRGVVKHFAGALCAHWTTENKTKKTRVSLDFRLVPGKLFRALRCGGAEPGGQRDVYREKDGYYQCCRRVPRKGGGACAGACAGAGTGEGEGGEEEWEWEREGPLLEPDARVGFPWTVKRWDKYLRKKRNKNQSSKASSRTTNNISTVQSS